MLEGYCDAQGNLATDAAAVKAGFVPGLCAGC